MKIVNVGDVLISPESMAQATANFERYDEVRNFYFGPRDKEEFRMYARNMEAQGSLCAPVPDEIMVEIADADVLQVHMMVVPEKVFEIGKNLKIVASNRGGTENIDLKAAEKFGVPVITNPAHNANAVADYAVAMMLAETRNISRCHAAFEKSRTWLEVFPNSGKIYEMKSKVIGLVGFGSIAHLVAHKLIHGFGCRVVATDPFVNAQQMAAEGVEKMELTELLAIADIVSLHMRVTPETKGIINAQTLKLMKPEAVLINTARSGLIDTEALIHALQHKQIMGAALDVFDVEPLPQNSPLLDLDNVTLTTHQAGVTVNAFDESPGMVLHEIERYFAGETPRFLKTSSATLHRREGRAL